MSDGETGNDRTRTLFKVVFEDPFAGVHNGETIGILCFAGILLV